MASEPKAGPFTNKEEMPRPAKLTELFPYLKYSEKRTAAADGLWTKPRKLNMEELRGGLSAKKSTSRRLFVQGKVKKDQPSRKTISFLPRYGTSYTARRTSGTLKAPQPSVNNKGTFAKPRASASFKVQQSSGRNQVYKSRFTSGPVQNINSRQNDKASQKRNKSVALGPLTNIQKTAERIKRMADSKIPTDPKPATKLGGGINVPKHNNKSGRYVEQMTNLEASISLVPLEDVEEKWEKEPSVFKSKFINSGTQNQTVDNMKINAPEHKSTQNQLESFVNKLDCLTNEVLTIKENLLFIVEKIIQIDIKCNHVNNKLDQYMTSDKKTVVTKKQSDCLSCPLESSGEGNTQTESAAVNTNAGIDSCASKGRSLLPVGKSELESPVTEKVSSKTPDKSINIPESECVCYSSRRKSARLQNKRAQTAYESLRKSTKLLITPVCVSNKKTRTPGRISRKVIDQLNDLYCD